MGASQLPNIAFFAQKERSTFLTYSSAGQLNKSKDHQGFLGGLFNTIHLPNHSFHHTNTIITKVESHVDLICSKVGNRSAHHYPSLLHRQRTKGCYRKTKEAPLFSPTVLEVLGYTSSYPAVKV